jgi:tungstate transport system substrate-binding protein
MNIRRFPLACSFLTGLVLPLWLASARGHAAQPPATLTLATTTSTRDTGLLDVLLPRFEEQTHVRVKVVAVGSGQALELGRRGDADVLLTHAPEAEQRFMAEGFGAERRSLMYNDFVLVGPAADPAQVRGGKSIVEAFRQLARAQVTFVSRGDESGTQAGLTPAGDWYLAAGSGMAAVLRLAGEKRGYTLSDRATYLSQRRSLGLAVLGEGDPLLRNSYAVILVSPAKHPHVQRQAARQFLEFLLSPEIQRAIAEFGVKEFGQPLFFPMANAAPSPSR